MFKRLVACFLAASAAVSLGGAPAGARSIDNLSYLFAGSTPIYVRNVSRTRENLTMVCPDYFELSNDGVVIKTREPDPLFIESMHREGVRVVPFVSNHWDQAKGRAAVRNAAVVAVQLAAWTSQYGFDGIDIDIENLNQNDRESFTAFLRTLRQRLPAQVTLSVCVAPNPWNLKTGWQGQYDMPALAGICDWVFLMAYDEHYDGDPSPGPVAGYPFVEKSVVNALKSVPASKLMLGVPFYGRYWIEGRETGGKALIMSDIENLTSRYASTVWYDTAQNCARARMTISPGDVSAGLWGGKKLSAGTYDIWYENDASLEKKLSLVKKYGLRGAGSWALGQESAGLWNGYRKWLYGLPFVDIEGLWAEPAIARLYDAKLVSGVGQDKFAPDETVSRAEVCVMLCKLLNIEPMESAPYIPPDIKGHWAEGYMLSAVYRRLVSGFPDGSYRPAAKISRQEMASIVEKTLQVANTIDFNQTLYSDVPAGLWSSHAITTLSTFGVVNGYPDGSFRPAGSMLRSEAASVIDKITGMSKKEFPLASLFETPQLVVEPR